MVQGTDTLLDDEEEEEIDDPVPEGDPTKRFRSTPQQMLGQRQCSILAISHTAICTIKVCARTETVQSSRAAYLAFVQAGHKRRYHHSMTGSLNPQKRKSAPVEVSLLEGATKRLKMPTLADGPCVRLRSGPVIKYPLILEAATMQVESLGDFTLSPLNCGELGVRDRAFTCAATSEKPVMPSGEESDPSIIDVWSQGCKTGQPEIRSL
ncbi:hypothetical protein PHYPSEUDO_015147 [Phytophthora pseudosyringae]|uniref:Uncharacterized protein n=1 Tax=Phytophthora pseudosyringae TaxID=221518 RepID=A0A8T1V452_9STRA|nr:hypothetical protein PHYPSEUDO_015147 [Phytophthora pseudosyringae]